MPVNQMLKFVCDNPNCVEKVTIHADAMIQSEREEIAPWISITYNDGNKEVYCRPSCAAQVLSVKSSTILVAPEGSVQ